MFAAEENLTADHAHAGTIAQDIFRRFFSVAANYGNAARHELGKRITHAAKHPQFRRLKTGIVFRHGHAAGADIAANVNLSLGHGIAYTVSGMAMHDNFSPPIQPSHIVRSGPQVMNGRIGKTHGTEPLPGCARYFDFDGLISRFPQPSPDAMLALGRNSQ